MPTEKKKVYMYYIFIVAVLYPVILIIADGYYLEIYYKYFIFIITLVYPLVLGKVVYLKKYFGYVFI